MVDYSAIRDPEVKRLVTILEKDGPLWEDTIQKQISGSWRVLLRKARQELGYQNMNIIAVERDWYHYPILTKYNLIHLS